MQKNKQLGCILAASLLKVLRVNVIGPLSFVTSNNE